MSEHRDTYALDAQIPATGCPTSTSCANEACGVGVAAPGQGRWKLLRVLAPAAMVSVGYMDPGNWATDLEGGARFGYQLLWVLVVSNLIALLLQNLSARLGIVTGQDLASACRAEYSKPLSIALWGLAEIGIIACDLAEVLGSALALNLLFGLPMLLGAVLTTVDVWLVLALQRSGRRWLEAVVVSLLATIALCMVIELVLARPAPLALIRGLAPKLNRDNLYVAVGILGATVMPHNLYLHSALVPQGASPSEQPGLLRQSFWGTALALNLALLINASILVLASAAFFGSALHVTDLRDAHRLLSPLLGSGSASILLAVGLLCAGQSSTVTGTLAGQAVMQGFLQLRLNPLLRRAVTRGAALVPALIVLALAGDAGVMPLLIASQVVLSLQLPFAIVPLVRLTSARALMGQHANSRIVKLAAAACTVLIVTANAALIIHIIADLQSSTPIGALLLTAASVAGLGLLCVVTQAPLRSARAAEPVVEPTAPRGALVGGG
jgi:manganese transport protein